MFYGYITLINYALECKTNRREYKNAIQWPLANEINSFSNIFTRTWLFHGFGPCPTTISLPKLLGTLVCETIVAPIIIIAVIIATKMTRILVLSLDTISVNACFTSKFLFSYRNTAKHMRKRHPRKKVFKWKWSGKNKVQAAEVSMLAKAWNKIKIGDTSDW